MWNICHCETFNMPRRRDKLLDSIAIIVFNIALPTLDVYSDLVLILTHLHYKVLALCISFLSDLLI